MQMPPTRKPWQPTHSYRFWASSSGVRQFQALNARTSFLFESQSLREHDVTLVSEVTFVEAFLYNACLHSNALHRILHARNSPECYPQPTSYCYSPRLFLHVLRKTQVLNPCATNMSYLQKWIRRLQKRVQSAVCHSERISISLDAAPQTSRYTIQVHARMLNFFVPNSSLSSSRRHTNQWYCIIANTVG